MKLPFRTNTNYVRDMTPCSRSYVTCIDVPQEDGQILPTVILVDGSNVAQTGDTFNTHSILYGGANVGEVSYQFPMARMDLADSMARSAESLLNAKEYLKVHCDDNSLLKNDDDINF